MQGNKCGVCGETFTDKYALMMHIGTRHGKLDKLLENKGLQHLIIAARPSKAKDASISDSFEHRENLDAQEAVESDFIAPLFDGCTCLVCGKVFESEEKTIDHVEFRHGKLKEDVEESNKTKKLVIKKSAEVKFCTSCEVCGKEFDAVSSLSQHMVRLHFWKEVKDTFSHLYEGNTCLVCSKLFPRQNSLIMHIGSVHRKIDQIIEGAGLRPLKSETAFKKIKEETKETSQEEEQ